MVGRTDDVLNDFRAQALAPAHARTAVLEGTVMQQRALLAPTVILGAGAAVETLRPLARGLVSRGAMGRMPKLPKPAVGLVHLDLGRPLAREVAQSAREADMELELRKQVHAVAFVISVALL